MKDTLTKTQEKQLVQFKEESLKVGLSTEPIKRDINEHRKIVDFIYKEYLNLPSPAIWYVDSPLMVNLLINCIFLNLEENLWQNLGQNLCQNLRQNLEQNLWQNLGQNLGQNLRQNLEQNLWQNLCQNLEQNLWQNLEQNLWQNLCQNLGQNLCQNLWQNLEQNLWQNLWQNLGQNLCQNLRQNLEQNLWQNLGQNLEQNLRQNLGQNLRQNLWQNLWQNLKTFVNVYWGNVDIYWLSFYIFPQKYLGIKCTDFELSSLNVFHELVKKIGWIWYFKDICFISDRPIEIHKNKEGRLHNENKPALLFKDGYCLWMLNGIEVPRHIIETSSEKLDARLILNEQNADIQREIIKKIGAERVLRDLNAKNIDEWKDIKTGHNYKLLELNVNSIKRKYLYYKHFCLDYYYAKPVPPETKSALEARAWIISVIERGDIGRLKSYEIEANLPDIAS